MDIKTNVCRFYATLGNFDPLDSSLNGIFMIEKLFIVFSLLCSSIPVYLYNSLMFGLDLNQVGGTLVPLFCIFVAFLFLECNVLSRVRLYELCDAYQGIP